MNESHSILQRMRELAVQSANDTNTESDRAQMQKEVDQLSQELSRIGNTTEFNTQNLLSGNFEGTFQIGANEGQNISIEIGDMRGFELGVTGEAGATSEATIGTFTEGSTIDDGSYTVTGNAEDGYTMEVQVTDGTDGGGTNGLAQTVTLTSANGNTFTGSTESFDDDGDGGTTPEVSDSIKIDFSTSVGPVTSGEVKLATAGSVQTATGSTEIANSGLQAGDYKVSSDGNQILDSNNKVVATHDGANGYASDGNVLLNTGTATFAGDSSIEVGGIDVSSQSAADSAITSINDAIESVSTQRSELGAFQNRLDHTINNLGTSAENLTAAESRIRDVDYDLAAA